MTSGAPSAPDAGATGGMYQLPLDLHRIEAPSLENFVVGRNRLPCAAHLRVARRNSLRALCALRSDNRRESEVRSALAR
ncbi:MAG: hypothetical protein R3E41_10385 [Burkholderiaceae bacterium]